MLAIHARSLTSLVALLLMLAGAPALGLGAGGEADGESVGETAAGNRARLVVLNKAEATASILDRDSGEEIARLPTGVGPHEAAVSPDAGWAVIADYGAEEPGRTLTVIDLTKLEVARTIDLGEHGRPHGIVYLPGGDRVLVTTEASQHLLAVDVGSGSIVSAMPTGGRLGHMVACTPDAGRAFVPHMGSATVAVLDLQSGERLALVDVGEQPEGIDVSPDGREVWVTNRVADTVSVLDAESLAILATLPCGEFPIRLKFTPDGRQVLISNARSGDVAVFDAKTREEVGRVSMEVSAVEARDERLFGDRFEDSPVPVGILVAPDGSVAWVANTNADVVTEVDLRTREIRRRLVAGTEPDGMAYVPVIGSGE